MKPLSPIVIIIVVTIVMAAVLTSNLGPFRRHRSPALDLLAVAVAVGWMFWVVVALSV